MNRIFSALSHATVLFGLIGLLVGLVNSVDVTTSEGGVVQHSFLVWVVAVAKATLAGVVFGAIVEFLIFVGKKLINGLRNR